MGVHNISINDNFFDLGGHSLQAIQLVSKMSVLLEHNISVKFLLSYQSIAAISDYFKEDYISNPEKSLETINKITKISNQLSSFSFLKFEKRSLLTLYNTRKIQKVDAVALGYLPNTLPHDMGLTKNEIIQKWFKNLPQIRRIFTTELGRICHITLPIFAFEIYNNSENLLDNIMAGIEIAKSLDAKVVSLTGLLPSATDYGNDVNKRVVEKKDFPKISTGHATTASSVIFAIKKILCMSNRFIEQEKVGLLGLGSIGLTSLRLMLKVLPHPLTITLCDVFGKYELLEQIKKEIIDGFGFKGEVKIVISKAQVPIDFYKTTFIIGATNIENVLNVDMLKPGTIIVDDSAPHCFDYVKAIQRFIKKRDILFTEGGMIKLNKPIHELRYMPSSIDKKNPFAMMVDYRTSDYDLMGCIFSSVFSAVFKDIDLTLGQGNIDNTIKHYKKLTKLGYEGANLSCRDYILPFEMIQGFRNIFGDKK